MFKITKSIFKLVRSILLAPLVLPDLVRFSLRRSKREFQLPIRNLYPQIFDKTLGTSFDRHYVYHTAWAARILAETRPQEHVDIASSLFFSAIVSAYTSIRFYDYRPANLSLSNLTSEHADLTNLSFTTDSIPSLSCMHTVEHIGLGRYGDPINPDGDLQACKELSRVLAPGGNLLFVVPVGSSSRIEFNAHRIYTYEHVQSLFPQLKLREFSLIPEHEKRGGLIRHADPTLCDQERYACGCFWFTKPTES